MYNKKTSKYNRSKTMKKIIFINVPISTKKAEEPIQYKVIGNNKLEYSGKVMCPINSILCQGQRILANTTDKSYYVGG